MTGYSGYIGWDGSSRVNWFICTHPIHEGTAKPRWCDHIQAMIQGGHDAEELTPGMHLLVPIVTRTDTWAEVEISEEVVGESALMTLHHTPDIGRPFDVSLGFWNPGEGMMSIRSVILDYIKSKVDPREITEPRGSSVPIVTRCPNNGHGLREARMMRDVAENIHDRWTCLWNIVMEKACTPCLATTEDVSDDNFGLESLGGSPQPGWMQNNA